MNIAPDLRTRSLMSMTERDWEQPGGEASGTRVSRREFLIGLAGGTAGVVVGGVAGSLVRDAGQGGWPDQMVLGDARKLLAEIKESGAPLIRPDTWSPTVAVIRWDPSLPRALDVYREEDHGIINDHNGLMLLNLRDPHLGCQVQWCPTSQWFENPCHGEKFNRWGEWMDGPSPRGLDRYVSRVEDGRYVVSLDRLLIGPAREARVLDEEPAGPHCVD